MSLNIQKNENTRLPEGAHMPHLPDHVCYYCAMEAYAVVKLPDTTPQFYLCLNCQFILDKDGTMLAKVGNFPSLYNPS
jgi:hypothetical protein